MIYDVLGVYDILLICYFSKNRSAQQMFLQLIMIYRVVYFMCQPSLNIFRPNYFKTIYKIHLSEKGRLFKPFNTSDWISAAAESSAP